MTSNYVKDKHDIGILRQDGTTKVGLMLVKDKNGAPRYGVFDDEYLAAQYFSGAPEYGNLPPEKELAIRQDDWRTGFGQEIYDTADIKRYYTSNGMDMRFKGMAIAGADPTAIGLPTYSYVAPTAATGTNWANLSNAVDGNTATYSTWSNLPDGTYTDFYIITIPSTVCDAVRVWWSSTNPSGSTADLDVLSGTAVTHVFEDVVAEGEYVTKTFAAQTVTSFRYRAGGNDVGHTEDINLHEFHIRSTTPLGTVLKGVEFNNSHYIARYNSLLKADAAGTTATFVKDYYPAVFTSIMPFADDLLYLAAGTTQPYGYCDTADAFVISNRTVNKFQFFTAVYATTPVLWGNDSVNTMRSNANPDNAGDQWGGTTTVGSAYHPITGLYSDLGSLYITKTDLPYYMDSAGDIQNDLAQDLASEVHSTDNGRNAGFWQGKFYIPWGTQTLLEYDVGTNTFLNPADYCTNLATFNGQVLAVAGDNKYLHAVLNYAAATAQVEVLAGRYEDVDNNVKWVWHPIAETAMAGCQNAWISSIPEKRLWISSTSNSDSLYYIKLPSGYGNITTDTNRKFKSGVTMTTSWLHGNFKSTPKAFPELELVMGHTFNADVYFTVQYQKLGDSDWNTLDDYAGTTTSMTESHFIPASSTSVNPVSTLFRLKFTAVTDDPDITPVLLSYHLKGILYPPQREIIACQVYCSNEITLKDGVFDRGSYDTIIDTLDEARVATWPVTIYDINGNIKTVKFLSLSSGTKRWDIIANEKSRVQERVYNLLMQIVDLS